MEYPHLQQIYARRGGDDFTILSVETTNRPQLAREFVQKVGATFPIVLDVDKKMHDLYSLEGVPYNLVIDRDGRVIFRHLGFAEGGEETLDAEIAYLLEGKGPAQPQAQAQGEHAEKM
ncbi:MAG: TlpA family protein disulfide reductase [Candidatus Eisenbacteria bacterium]|nr:TlpA disulfide reductase family protein [Candidatus Eisenbacteria bacterium]